MHDVSEIAGLSTHSFGEEDVDRHIQVCVKDRQLLMIRSDVRETFILNWSHRFVEGVEERVQPM